VARSDELAQLCWRGHVGPQHLSDGEAYVQAHRVGELDGPDWHAEGERRFVDRLGCHPLVDAAHRLHQVRREHAIDLERAHEDQELTVGDRERQVVEGTQVLAQMIVAAAKRFPEKSVRSAYAVFARAVMVGAGPVELEIDVVSEGRSTATAVISAKQNDKRCITATILADVPTGDVIRHHLPRPEVAGPADSNVSEMPMVGRELRLVDVVDVNSPDEVGPPELYAWLHYDPIPTRDDLAKALIAYFTGHLGISTTMRAHEGIGTSQAHLTVSTAPMTVTDRPICAVAPQPSRPAWTT
jgi:acyl-CoA thioesterase